MTLVKVFSSDLNGTLVHQHTMSDMIRVYIGEEQFKKADAMFKRQMSGTATMQEAFETAGALTKGLTLRQAMEYTRTHITYVNGFRSFLDELHQRGIPLVVNSTGYSVTVYSIQEQIGEGMIHGSIGNFLMFGMNGEVSKTLSEDDVRKKVHKYFTIPSEKKKKEYDTIQATGVVTLGIVDEHAKSELLQEYVKKHFSHVFLNEIAHMGDTMGDSGGIVGVARRGGVGIAFNYNSALKDFLEKVLAKENMARNIFFVDARNDSSNFMNVLPMILKK